MFFWMVDRLQEDLDAPSDFLMVRFRYLVGLVQKEEGDANHPSCGVGVACGSDWGWFPCHVPGPC